MAKADYEVVGTRDRTVYIVDLDQGAKSITNDAEAVVTEIAADYPGLRIVYRDTMARWDELVHRDGVFELFRPWRGHVPALQSQRDTSPKF